jgi:hypothetical protein
MVSLDMGMFHPALKAGKLIFSEVYIMHLIRSYHGARPHESGSKTAAYGAYP